MNAGLSKAAKEEHARDLPIMNGIKEIIKSVEVLDSRSLNYKETLYNLSNRLKSLQVIDPTQKLLPPILSFYKRLVIVYFILSLVFFIKKTRGSIIFVTFSFGHFFKDKTNLEFLMCLLYCCSIRIRVSPW